MTQYRSGLQKNISAIFEDAPALNQDGSIVSPNSGTTNAEKIPQQAQTENIQTPSESSQAPSRSPAVPNCPQKQTAVTTTPLGGSLALKLANEQNPDAKKTKVPAAPTPPPRNTSKKQNDTVKAETAKPVLRQGILEKVKNRFFAEKPGLSTKRQVATAMLIPILAIAFIAILIKVFALPVTKKAQAEMSDVSPSFTAADSINWQLPQPYPADLRDPMKFAQNTEVSIEKNELFINGILHSEDKPTVIIGNKIFHVGERVGDAVITKIDIYGVEFESNGRKWTQTYDNKNEAVEINSSERKQNDNP